MIVYVENLTLFIVQNKWDEGNILNLGIKYYNEFHKHVYRKLSKKQSKLETDYNKQKSILSYFFSFY